MRITQVEYLCSAVNQDQYPKGQVPEVALLGRSNVGKSSAINRMVNRKALAHVSGTPGKTHTLNFFKVNDAFHLVDLPGYGYARAAQSDRESWARFIEAYLTTRTNLVASLLVVDLRHPPTPDDRLMREFIRSRGLPIVVLATKADQVKRAQWRTQALTLTEGLDLGPQDALVLFSAREAPTPLADLRAGVDAAWRALLERAPVLKA